MTLALQNLQDHLLAVAIFLFLQFDNLLLCLRTGREVPIQMAGTWGRASETDSSPETFLTRQVLSSPLLIAPLSPYKSFSFPVSSLFGIVKGFAIP